MSAVGPVTLLDSDGGDVWNGGDQFTYLHQRGDRFLPARATPLKFESLARRKPSMVVGVNPGSLPPLIVGWWWSNQCNHGSGSFRQWFTTLRSTRMAH